MPAQIGGKKKGAKKGAKLGAYPKFVAAYAAAHRGEGNLMVKAAAAWRKQKK
jgi:hypothetical protein